MCTHKSDKRIIDKLYHQAKLNHYVQGLLIALLCLVCTHAYAALTLELTQGVVAALPIAVVPFAGQPADNTNNISDIISQDLQNSGYFRVIPAKNYQQLPHQVGDVHYGYWRNLNIDNVLVGDIVPLSHHRYQVKFALIDIPQQKVLFNRQITVTASEYRRLAHYISDLIYNKLTGIPGIFSTRIAYVVVQRTANKPTRYILEVADADGYGAKPLLISNEPIMSPAWSPDGKQIAYVSFENNRSQIYVTEVATGKRRKIAAFNGINGAPAWSPDGTRLALVLSKTGHPKIYTLDLASGHLQQVTEGWSIDTEPDWSPDGQSLLFTSNRGGKPQVYQVNLLTQQVKRVTFKGNYNASAQFTQDGKSLVLLHRQNNRFSIALLDLGSDRLEELSRSDADESPSISPNGKMILFATRDQGQGILSVISTDGRIKLRLPARQGDVQEPAWSPYLTRAKS
ncbi:MAG: Tol-Pal system beta propeller repeat protein TolB [Gammaproteobacteria bacterium]